MQIIVCHVTLHLKLTGSHDLTIIIINVSIYKVGIAAKATLFFFCLLVS